MHKIEKWIEEKQKTKGLSFFKGCLYFLSLFFKSGVFIRHAFYGRKLFETVEVDLPIISVGNIVCGGTGKTEFVGKLITDLKRNGVAVLTRGYRSKRGGASALVKDIDDGDEPFMLANRLKNSFVIRGLRREESAKLAETLGACGCILDDGMQYLRLKKDISIAMISASDPISQGFVPFGMRRELLSQLRKVDYIGIHGAKNQELYELVKKDLLCYGSAKFFGTTYCLKENKRLAGKKVGVFCGIGNPQFFIEGLRALNLDIVKSKILADHEKCTGLLEFVQLSQSLGAEIVVCTAKDFVKLSIEEKKLVIPIQISMEIEYDVDVYRSLLEQVNDSIENYKQRTKEKL